MTSPDSDDPNHRARILAAEAVRELQEAGVLREPPGLLDMSYRQCRQLAAQGWAIAKVCELLDRWWAPVPDSPLVDVLKAQPRNLVEQCARILTEAGLSDLSDLLLPDPGMTAFEVPDEPDPT